MRFVHENLTVRISNKQADRIDEMCESMETNRSRFVRALLDDAWDNYVRNNG